MNAPTGIYLPPLIDPVRQLGGRTVDLTRRILVMAVINRTPNSFHDRGRTFELGHAIAAAESAVEAGADIVDIGGFPFGPNKPHVEPAEELRRVLPVVKHIRRHSDVAISVDTWRASVAREVLAAGASMINDTSGLHEPELAGLVAEAGAHLGIAHSLASPPNTPVLRPSYDDLPGEIEEFLLQRIFTACGHGLDRRRIILDPGHDLNKNTRHSLELTRALTRITRHGFPVLVSTSNKDFLAEAGGWSRDDLLEATLTVNVICAMLGARIWRVHDVPAAVKAATTFEAAMGWRQPAQARHNLA